MPARSDNFQKFVKKKKGSAIKEEIKQAKKKEKKERAAAIEAHYERKRAEKMQRQGGTAGPFRAKSVVAQKPAKLYGGRTATANTTENNKFDKPFASDKATGPGKKFGKQADDTSSKAPYKSSAAASRNKGKPVKHEKVAATSNGRDRSKQAKPGKGGSAISTRDKGKPNRLDKGNPVGQDRSTQKNTVPANGKYSKPDRATAATPNVEKKPVKQDDGLQTDMQRTEKPALKRELSANKKPSTFTKVDKASAPHKESAPSALRRTEKAGAEQMPLNKFIAHGGICSRRDAAELVRGGKVTVNGALVTDPGVKVSTHDDVKLNNKKVVPTNNLVYILLNKPKDFITTSDDPQGRKTVLDLVRTATTERVYPVGRLDRNTSGVLLLTNDGELAQKLSHPKHEIKKVYEVKLDRPLAKADFEKIGTGITLEDGFVAPDVIAYADSKDKSIIGIEIHSGRNRIVRRIFEHLKYDVKGLDRVMFAGLTKKDVLRGTWRFLKDKEVRLLKYMNQSFSKTND